MHHALVKRSDVSEENIDCIFRVTFLMQCFLPIEVPNVHFQVFTAMVDSDVPKGEEIKQLPIT